MDVQPAHLLWTNLSYDVNVKNESGKIVRKNLLKSVNGFVRPGSMLALMGSSGAGKTTLLDVIAQRKKLGFITGSLEL